MKAPSPKHSSCKWVLTLLAGIGAGAVLLLLVPHEPWFRFHRLSYWAARARGPGADQEQARDAIRQIGSKGIPYLFNRLRKLEVQRRKTAVWDKLPVRLQDYVSPPTWDAAIPNETEFALGLLGSAVIPQLLAAVQDPNSDVQVTALRALGKMGSNADATLPTLLRSMAYTNGNVRLAAVFAISQLGSIKTQAIPALVAALQDSNRGPDGGMAYVREAAAEALGDIGPDARTAVPDLAAMLNDPEPYTQRAVGLALWRITHDTNWISQFTAELQKASNPQEYRTYLDLLALIGPKAKSAVPVILAGTTNFHSDMSRPVRAALRHIDPEAAASFNHSGK